MDGLTEFKSRLKAHDKLAKIHSILDDAFLSGFLNGKKGHVGKAMECMEYFIYVRTVKYKNFSKTFKPSTTTFLDGGMYKFLKNKDKEGRTVVVCKHNRWDPTQTTFAEVLASTLYLIDEVIRSNCTECVAISDCNGVGFQHMSQIIQNFRMGLDLSLKSLPARPQQIHFINQGVLEHNFLRFAKPFLPSKLRNRLFLHSQELSSLHDFIPKNILPHSLGGDLSDEDAYDDDLIERVKRNDAFYENLLIAQREVTPQ